MAQEIASNKQFGGYNKRYQHASTICGCDMKFTVYLPPGAKHGKVPVLYYLSGLTCTDENFIQKAGAQRKAAELGIALVAPDTSPRGLNVAGESESWDFGVGAGFYLNATVDKWKNWRMYDYIVDELPAVIKETFPQIDTTRSSIMGHSMGGHGAITIGLGNADKYLSISALAPITNPTSPDCAVGIKALTGYLGPDQEAWKQYDSCEVIRRHKGPKLPLLVDQGDADNFLSFLMPQALKAAAEEANYPLHMRMLEGYDHSYFFISSFIDEHIAFHAKELKK